MKITKVNATAVILPGTEPLADMLENPKATRPLVAIEIETDQGIVGIGIVFFGGPVVRALRQAVEDLGLLIVGEDPLRIEAIHRKLYDLAGTSGPGGIFTLALSGLDMALWDIKGKALDLPVWKLLGGGRDKVPAYASGALMRGLTLDQCVKACRALLDKGYFQAKMQLALPGKTSPAIEIERARVIREALGPDFSLMCDINQRWRVEQAITIGKRLEEYNLFWLEDVTTADDYAGLARIADALTTPVAGGEYVYGLTSFRHMLEARSVDVVMADPFRAGGITGWMKIAALAEAFNLPIVSHLAPEIQVHCVGAAPNGLTVEYMPWTYLMYEEVPWPKDGMLEMPKGPGLGLKFDKANHKRYAA